MPKKILIIDDSITVRQQVGAVLSQAGFEVVEAVDGIEGAELIASRTDIAVVVCDINMPRMNGLDMVRKVKSDPTKASLPIILLTTEGSPALIQQAKSAGAKGWILKPFNGDKLLATVQQLTS